jgi:hypothetical protein
MWLVGESEDQGRGKSDGRAFCAPFARLLRVLGVLCISFVRPRENACRDRVH